MNKHNLLRMADYIETIPQNMFDMSVFRSNYYDTSPKCGSVGCVIGHCTILDSQPLPIIKHNPKSQEINFSKWSEKFTGLERPSNAWRWCFGVEWTSIDNTPTGAAARIRYLVANEELPEHGYKLWKKALFKQLTDIYKPFLSAPKRKNSDVVDWLLHKYEKETEEVTEQVQISRNE